jgi:2-phosphosulfolactate phosphatase
LRYWDQMPFTPVYIGIEDCEQVRGTAVVIDVLRAFTTAAWAFHLAVERIILSADLDEALELKARFPGSLALKDAEPHPGFELSNSPIELQGVEGLAGRALVQKTTAGTVGAVAARRAENLYCASFVCAQATAQALRDADTNEAYFVVTGDGGAAEEDRVCAEYIGRLVDDWKADPRPYLERAAASRAASALRRRVEAGTPGMHARDLEACLHANRFDFAMRVQDEQGLLVLRPYNCH